MEKEKARSGYAKYVVNDCFGLRETFRYPILIDKRTICADHLIRKPSGPLMLWNGKVCVMRKQSSFTLDKASRNWILFGIPVVFLAAGLLHFVYDWSGEATIVGLFTPVNESVWEHLKLLFWPLFVWWMIGCF